MNPYGALADLSMCSNYSGELGTSSDLCAAMSHILVTLHILGVAVPLAGRNSQQDRHALTTDVRLEQQVAHLCELDQTSM